MLPNTLIPEDCSNNIAIMANILKFVIVSLDNNREYPLGGW